MGDRRAGGVRDEGSLVPLFVWVPSRAPAASSVYRSQSPSLTVFLFDLLFFHGDLIPSVGPHKSLCPAQTSCLSLQPQERLESI